MFFLRKKRQHRDRLAGLVFRWRGSKRHHTGKFIALASCSAFFAFLVYAVEVEGVRPPLLTKRTGQVVMLHEADPRISHVMMQIENQSPFVIRWDPAFDQEAMGRIDTATSLLEGRVWDYQPTMMPLPERQETNELPPLVGGQSGLLDASYNQWRWAGSREEGAYSVAGSEVAVSAILTGDPEVESIIATRQMQLPIEMIADEWFGQTFRYLIEVDATGVVRSCLPVSGGSMEVAKPTRKQQLLALWLRQTRFQAHRKTSGLMGVIEVEIQAQRR